MPNRAERKKEIHRNLERQNSKLIEVKREQLDELYKAIMACDIGDIYEVNGVRHEIESGVEAVEIFDNSHAGNVENVNKALDIVRGLFSQ